jgi:hypothetical protein
MSSIIYAHRSAQQLNGSIASNTRAKEQMFTRSARDAMKLLMIVAKECGEGPEVERAKKGTR